MRRTLIVLLVALLSVSAASAITQISGRCAKADYPGTTTPVLNYVHDHPTQYNCFDVDCALVDQNGNLITSATYANGTSGGTPLRANASYVITTITDLSQPKATCTTPTFTEALCSSRGAWNVAVRITRYFVEDSRATQSLTHQDLPNVFPSMLSASSGVTRESFVKSVPAGYFCADLVKPQLLVQDSFDLRTGTRTLHMLFSDNEYDYMHTYNDPNPVHLLMNTSTTEKLQAIDGTTLSSCGYAILPSAQAKPTPPAFGATPSGPWTSVPCSLYQQAADATIPAGQQLSGSTLWMFAYDSRANLAENGTQFATYYPANGNQGYCPQPGECLLDAGPGADQTSNTFARYVAGGPKPACIAVGQGADDAYCSSSGLVERSEAMLAYGAQQLGTSTGAVACGYPAALLGARASASAQLCGGSTYSSTCSLTCLVSEDTAPSSTQPASAIFAANNYLVGGPGTDEVHLPPYVSATLQTDTKSNENYANVSGCLTGQEATCTMQLVQNRGPSRSVSLRYDNASGIGTLSQTMSLAPFTQTREYGGEQILLKAGLDALAKQMTVFATDLAEDPSANYVPSYTGSSIGNSALISAYRNTPSGTIIGLTANAPGFVFAPPQGSSIQPPTTLYEVGVIYTGSFDLSYINTAKDAIRTVSQARIRQVTTPVAGTTGSNTLIITVAAKTPQDAQQIIGQLVTRLRPKGT